MKKHSRVNQAAAMIIDTHAHIFSSAGPFMEGARYRPAYDALLADWLGLWTHSGVTHGVLVQPSFLGTDNGYMIDAVAQRPDILRAVVVIAPETQKPQLLAWDAAGVRGVRLNLIGADDLATFASEAWRRLYAGMADLGWHLEVQCEGERMAGFLSHMKDVPVTLVIDHFGLPEPGAHGVCAGVQAVLKEAEKRQVFVKLSAPYRLRGADAAAYTALYLSELGPQRLLWGSDWPWTNHESGRTYEGCLQPLKSAIPSEAVLSSILWDTPKRLYGF